MQPRYEPGEIVYVAPNRFPRAGADCVVVTTSDEGLLKRFIRREAAKLVLHQLNPDEDLDIELKRVAQIHTVVGRG
jgi:phage repressor protein C with HTH and peptisase S24 domain